MTPAIYVGLGAFVLGAAAGWQTQAWRWGAADAERLRQEQADTAAQAATADAAAYGHEQAKVQIQERIRYVTREVDRIVERPLYRDGVCLDGDGLRLVAQAVGAAASAGESAAAVPAASAASR
jgi:hypothetical protein